jgi:hypothetical protein
VKLNVFTTLVPQLPSGLCQNATPFTLSAIPVGGQWSGSGISQAGTRYFLDVCELSVGKHPIHYSHPPEVASLPGCEKGIDVDFTVKPVPIFTILEKPEGEVCSNVSKQLKPSTIQAGVTYNWETPNGGIFSQATIGFMYHPGRWPPGLYTLTANKDGCTFKQETTVNFKPAPIVIGKEFYTVRNNTKPCMPVFSPAGGILESKFMKDGLLAPELMPKGTSYFNYTVTGENGCATRLYGQIHKIQKSASFSVAIQSSATGSICAYEKPTTLTASTKSGGTVAYSWTMQEPGKPMVSLPENSPTITATETANYCITATSPELGAVSTCRLITIIPEPPKPIIEKSAGCLGLSKGCFTATIPSTLKDITFTWFRNGVAINGASSSQLPYGELTGIYSVRIATPCLGPISEPMKIPDDQK